MIYGYLSCFAALLVGSLVGRLIIRKWPDQNFWFYYVWHCCLVAAAYYAGSVA